MTDDSFYEVLGVDSGASRDELRAAYRARVESLEAAREGKGVTDATLRANRDETARVRSAWNVLSDPFQRQRYDAQLEAPAEGTSDDAGSEDANSATGAEVELTGWRKLLAPPPPKQPRNGSAPAGGDNSKPAARPGPQPTIPLPAGVTLADTRTRGMALLFDISILLLIYIGVQFFVPNLIQSDYKDITDQISTLTKQETNQNDKADDLSDRADTAKNNGNTDKAAQLRAESKAARDTADARGKQADKLSDDIKGTQYTTLVIIFVLFMLYLVPMTVLTGRTLGMRGRKIKVLRVNGAPVTWFPGFVRYFVPIAIALAVPTLGPVLGLGLVLWSFRDPNRMGIHDKLAKTIVVNE